MGISIVQYVPLLEEYLCDHGFRQQSVGRRGRQFTHNYFDGIVAVRSAEGSIRAVDHTEIAGYFEEISDALTKLEDKPGAVVFEGGGSVDAPEWFQDWCREHGVTLHVIHEDNALGLAKRLADGMTRAPTLEDRIIELEHALGAVPFPMHRGDVFGRKLGETEAEHWLRRLEEWLRVKKADPHLWDKMVRGD